MKVRLSADDEELVSAYERLGTINKVAENYRVAPATVQRRLAMIRERYPLLAARLFIAGFKPRPRYSDLLPWRLMPEHTTNYPATMLRYIAKLRTGEELDSPRREHQARMYEAMLNATGKVVSYDRRRGFSLVDRLDTDEDIIRKPDE